ncbi:MAG TPA: hypothetical protein VJ603_03190 [Paucimonas sp.]|nr:hypothetical protein [Paucimonas sp.]HJW56265.1 hypothetical protein [Burkholderiaceae bacterium]
MSTDITFFRTAMSTGAEYLWTAFWNGAAWEIHAHQDTEQAPCQLRTTRDELREFQTLDAVAGVMKTMGIGRFSVNQNRSLPHEKQVLSGGEQCIGT